ncbi:MAG: ATP-binding protein [Bacteroidales bacterium]
MERLIKLSVKKASTVSTHFQRYLYADIDWEQALSLILGHRGTGKTTILLQRIQQLKKNAIYLSLDDVYFEANRLVELIDALYEKGYRHFMLDEVHRYKYWSKDIKNAFDNYSDIKIAATGSSILELNKGQSDLSRRAARYSLWGLSLREFIEFEYKQIFDNLTLENILEHHQEISSDITDLIDIEKVLREYLRFGYYPFFNESIKLYAQRLQETTNLVLDIDVAPFIELSHTTVRNMKKLFYVISQTVPFTPNISKIAEKINAPRNTVLKILDILEHARILSLLRQNTKGISYLQKPEKIYLQNTNLAYILSDDKPNIGNLRETFFLSQLKAKHEVTASKFSDFMLDNTYTFEIGGASKTSQQIKGIPNSFIAADGIKNGSGNKIPLWMFGFLY